MFNVSQLIELLRHNYLNGGDDDNGDTTTVVVYITKLLTLKQLYLFLDKLIIDLRVLLNRVRLLRTVVPLGVGRFHH